MTITCTIASLATHSPALLGITQGALNFMQWWLYHPAGSGTYIESGTINLSGEFEEDYTFTVEMPADSANGNYVIYAWMCTAESGTPDYNIDFPYASLSASDIMQIHEARRARADFAYAGEDMAVSLDFAVPIAEIKLVNTGAISVPHQMVYACVGFYPSEYNIVTNKPADSMTGVRSFSDTFSVLASAATEYEMPIVAAAYGSDGTLLAMTDAFAVKHKAGQQIIFEYSLNYGEFAVNATTLKSIADKVRALTGDTGYMKVKDIAASIPQAQVKEVLITENGITEITPDDGKVFSKVSINTDIQTAVENGHTVTFEDESGNIVYKVTVPNDESLSAPPVAPAKTDYLFAGWYANLNEYLPLEFPYTPTADVMLKPKYVARDQSAEGETTTYYISESAKYDLVLRSLSDLQTLTEADSIDIVFHGISRSTGNYYVSPRDRDTVKYFSRLYVGKKSLIDDTTVVCLIDPNGEKFMLFDGTTRDVNSVEFIFLQRYTKGEDNPETDILLSSAIKAKFDKVFEFRITTDL